jgi:radical SAM protein with 4Fe4S-binding SPASM domain
LIETHISYNGRESHDLTRPSAGGKTTSSEVRETLEWFVANEIPFYILMSLTMETISMLFDSYKELNEFSTAPSLVERSCYPIFNYLEGQTLSQIDREALVLNLKKIAALILREKSRGRTPLNFDWFNANAITRCGAGASNFSIDTDGSIYPCYLCAYDNEKAQHLLGDVTSDFETILKAGEKYVALAQKPLAGPCSSCNVSFCNRCPAARFKTSSKTGYDERWTDYSSSSAACEISSIVDLVARAFRRLDGQDAVH